MADGEKGTWGHRLEKDEIVEEIHRWRADYAAQFDYSLEEMVKDLPAKERANPAKRAHIKLVEPKPPAATE